MFYMHIIFTGLNLEAMARCFICIYNFIGLNLEAMTWCFICIYTFIGLNLEAIAQA
jgi:hypothetical protein